MKLNHELIEKVKSAKDAEELLAMAKENGEEMNEESAKAYFELLHPQTGEISDDELDNVSGGGCHTKDGREIVTVCHSCGGFVCKECGGRYLNTSTFPVCKECGKTAICNNCQYCTYEKGLWLCNK